MLNSVMKHKFSQVPKAEIPRSQFDRSHGYKTTFDAGYLVPFYIDECLPGDTFNLKMTGFARMATPIKPIMDNLYMETFFFAVPVRLLWEHWENLMGEQENPGDSTEYVVPTMSIPALTQDAHSLYDYMGLPIYASGQNVVSTFHFRAYNMIWNEWFRDQNLQDKVIERKGDTGDTPTDYNLLRRGKRHDYFTSCLPWPQKGDAVQIPGSIGDLSANIIPSAEGHPPSIVPADDRNTSSFLYMGTDAQDKNIFHTLFDAPASQQVAYWDETGMDVEFESEGGTTATINDLRTAFQLQKMLERDARGGTRYTEVIYAHFGVSSPDARLQRPEFLGGGSSRININPVQQTSNSETDASPQGNLAAYGTAQLSNHGFVKSFTEHCVIIGLVNVRADLTYSQGLSRMWIKRTRFDFFWPAFANIGEQEVYDDEIYSENAVGDPDGPVFGYQERYAEYRYKPSQITGLFRSQAPESLDIWHVSQDFASSPPLNAEFIEDDPPIDRVIAVPSEPHFLFDSYIRLRCARPMPLFGVPGNIDRF